MPDVKTAEQIAQSQYVFGILFILLFLLVIVGTRHFVIALQKKNDQREQELREWYAEQRRESREREQRLMQHLERTTETLEKIERSVVTLEHNTHQSFKEIWRQLNGRDK